MKLNEALYFAFVIGASGNVRRHSWEAGKYISDGVHCSNENDPNTYLFVGNNINYNVKLNNSFKDSIQVSLRGYKVWDKSFGLPLSQEDVKAEDWKVDNLMYTGVRF
jgi:hypothetical protein